MSNNNNNQIIKYDSVKDQQNEEFIVKRTEITDVNFFIDEKESCLKFFDPLFGKFNLEVLYETSLFSVTIHSIDRNSVVGLFIFNDSPIGPYKREGFPRINGIWEEWYSEFYEDLRLDGKNSLWLIYACVIESYCISDDVMKKIFHRVHLSLYTTLPNIKGVYICFLNDVYSDIINSERKYDETETENENPTDNLNDPYDEADFERESTKTIIINPFYVIKVLLNYIYDVEVPLLEVSNKKVLNNTSIKLNLRDRIFHMIEIREGTQEDHDDLENIFKSQTSPEVANSYEDFFIAKMIADKDVNKKVLVGQVNDKAIGMLAISTDVNIDLLVKSFELEKYDNLSKQDFMRAVNYKRKLITEDLLQKEAFEKEKMILDYQREVRSCEVISQRILLQEYVIKSTDRYLSLEQLEKQKNTNEQFAIKYFNITIQNYEMKQPNFDQFQGKIHINQGNSLLIDKLNFYLETLNFFGLPKNYLKGEGHWENYLKQLEKKRAMREAWKKQMQKDTKPTKKVQKKAQKNQDELAKKKDFDFEPFDSSINLCRKANLNMRSQLRKVINENKSLIASFFVNEKGEPSELRCFDLLNLTKKLKENKVNFNDDLQDLVLPILTCFGNLQFDKVNTTKVVEIDENKDVKDDKKKKKDVKKKKEIVVEDKKEAKKIEITMYLISIGELFKSVKDTYEYDKTLYELGLIKSERFEIEYESNKENEINEKKIVERQETEYEKLKKEVEEENLLKSKEEYEAYIGELEEYNNVNDSLRLPEYVLNAFCVRVFFIEQAFESRSTDFLLKAFDAFPDKDYIIVTQPHTFSENSLLDPFIRVEKKVDSLFQEILYILHRESLLISLLKVDFSKEDDLKNSIYLFENIGEEASSIYQTCLDSIKKQDDSKFICVTLKINRNIIGICVISKEINVKYYDSHFNIKEYINISNFSKSFHGRILFFSLHKNFVQFTKLAFKEITRLVSKFNLFFEIQPFQKLPPFAKDLIYVSNRKFPHFLMKTKETKETKEFPFESNTNISSYYNNHSHIQLYEDEKIRSKMDGEERDENDFLQSDFCLMLTTKRMLSDNKISNNNRIVVVGASDCGISFIESLLSISYINFTHIYLIAPGGLMYHHIETERQNLKISYSSYQIKELKRLMLESRIKIIDSKMKNLNRANKFLLLEDGSVIYYDYLILTLGLQEKLGFELNNLVIKQINEYYTDYEKKIENEIQENNSIIQSQNSGQQPLNAKEGKDPKKENQNLIKEIGIMKQNWQKVLSSLNFISIDDPRLYSKFSAGTKLMRSLKKNPVYELIIYGRSLNLLCFIQGMLERGISGKKLKLVIPTITSHAISKEIKGNQLKKELQQMVKDELEFTNNSSLETSPEVEAFILESFEKEGVRIYKDFNYNEVLFSETKESIVGYEFSHEGTEKKEVITGNYFITGGLLNVDLSLFHIIHDNGLVYNGRTIVNKNFTTCDPSIFAAGRLCEFSQQYQYIEKNKILKLEGYNSKEVGYSLAKSFFNIVESLSTDVDGEEEKKLPSFFIPQSFGCVFNNNYKYFKAKSIRETNKIILNKEKTREDIVFNNLHDENNSCYLKFSFNLFGIIDEVTYYGKTEIEYSSLLSLVGLHENYLNSMFERYEVSLIDDLTEFLTENWAMALFHDKFSSLILTMKNVIMMNPEYSSDIKRLVNTILQSDNVLDRDYLPSVLSSVRVDLKKKLEMEIISFLSENKNQVPFYFIPQSLSQS